MNTITLDLPFESDCRECLSDQQLEETSCAAAVWTASDESRVDPFSAVQTAQSQLLRRGDSCSPGSAYGVDDADSCKERLSSVLPGGGGLIQTPFGKGLIWGGPLTKRSGCSLKASLTMLRRASMTFSARPW